MSYLINILILFLLLFFPLAQHGQPEVLAEDSTSSEWADKIAAVVNTELILKSDIDRVLAAFAAEYKSVYPDNQGLEQQLKQVQENIINQMVEEKLVLSEAKQYNIEVDEDLIIERIDKIKEAFPSEQAFEQALSKQGLRLKDLRDRFYDQEIMKKAVNYFVRSKIKVEPIEIRLFFQDNQEQFVEPEQGRLKSIFIKVDESLQSHQALERAKIVLERLRKGENFETLTKEYSQGPTAEKGGDIGFIARGQLLKEIDAAVFKLKPGEFTDVIKTEQGFRIFKLEETKPGRELSFQEVQERIREILFARKFDQQFKQWIDKLKQNAYIQIR